MDKLQRDGRTPSQILKQVNAGKRRRRASLASKTAVYRYLGGETYKRDAAETRGRPVKVDGKAMAVYDRVRKRLQKESENEWCVTWDDIAAEAQTPRIAAYVVML